MPSSIESRPYVDELGRTDAETYLMGVLDGTIVAGKKLVKLAKKMLPRIRNGYKRWHYDPDAATRPVEFIETFCKIPSGNIGMPFILEPYERMIVELTFGFVDDDGLRQFRAVTVLMARKNGKALSLDTEIPTPDGWRTMGELHAGDVVFGQDGKPSTIIAESEIFDKPTYLVRFEDGSNVKASGDHVWTVWDTSLGFDAGWHDVTTSDMYDDNGERRYLVPLCQPVEHPVVDWDRSLYVMGAEWIAYDIDRTVPSPDEIGSVDQRREFLEGLTCASMYFHFTEDNNVSTCSRAVADSVASVCASLGYLTWVVERDGRYVCCFDEDAHSKAVVSIERIPNEPTKCIAIDNQSHLYLVGRQYTATHNSSLAAAMEIYMLVADHEGSPQIYNVATGKSQASLGFGAAQKMIQQSPHLKKLVRRRKVVERAEVGLVCQKNLGYIIPCSRNTDVLDGLDVHCVVVDEMSAIKDRSIYDLLRQGMGARRQPLVIAITTEGRVRDGLWDSEHLYAEKWLDDELDEEDDRFLGILFELDDKSEIFGPEENWAKASPGLGTVKGWEYLRSEVIKAKNDPSYLSTVLTKEFNIRANQAASFLTYEESYNPTKFDFGSMGFKYGIVGLDAADTIDLNAATVLCMRPGDDHIYRRSMYWIAEEQVKVNSNNQRGRDGVPYQEWERQGYIRIVPGNKVDRKVFLDWIDELYADGVFVVGVSHDRWGIKEIDEELDSRIGKKNNIPVPFGAMSLSVPMKQLKADMRDGRIIDGDNPIDHWCNANVTVKEDVNGNIQPIKVSGPTSRIDGFAALLCAYKHLMERWDDYQMYIGG